MIQSRQRRRENHAPTLPLSNLSSRAGPSYHCGASLVYSSVISSVWANGDRPTPLTPANRRLHPTGRGSRCCRPAECHSALHVDKPGQLPLGEAGWIREGRLAEAQSGRAQLTEVDAERPKPKTNVYHFSSSTSSSTLPSFGPHRVIVVVDSSRSVLKGVIIGEEIAVIPQTER